MVFFKLQISLPTVLAPHSLDWNYKSCLPNTDDPIELPVCYSEAFQIIYHRYLKLCVPFYTCLLLVRGGPVTHHFLLSASLCR